MTVTVGKDTAKTRKTLKVGDKSIAYYSIAAAEAAGVSLNVLQLDVQDSDTVSSAVAQVLTEQGRIDTLINNAGAALWLSCGAGISTVQYEPMMSVQEELLWHELEELFLHFKHILTRRNFSTVGNSKYMRVDGHRDLSKSRIQHDICCLSADAR